MPERLYLYGFGGGGEIRTRVQRYFSKNRYEYSL